MTKILNEFIRDTRKFNGALRRAKCCVLKNEFYIILICGCILSGCVSSLVALFLTEYSNEPVTLRPAVVLKPEQNFNFTDTPDLNPHSTGIDEIDFMTTDDVHD